MLRPFTRPFASLIHDVVSLEGGKLAVRTAQSVEIVDDLLEPQASIPTPAEARGEHIVPLGTDRFLLVDAGPNGAVWTASVDGTVTRVESGPFFGRRWVVGIDGGVVVASSDGVIELLDYAGESRRRIEDVKLADAPIALGDRFALPTKDSLLVYGAEDSVVRIAGAFHGAAAFGQALLTWRDRSLVVRDHEGTERARVDLDKRIVDCASFGGGVAIQLAGSHSLLWWRREQPMESLEHDVEVSVLRAVTGGIASAEENALLVWRVESKGPDVEPVSAGDIPQDTPIVTGGALVRVRTRGRFALRAEGPAGWVRVQPGATYRPLITREAASPVLEVMLAKSVEGNVPTEESVAALGQRPLADTLPLIARALFAPESLEPAAVARAEQLYDQWFAELGAAFGVSGRVMLGAARARKFPLPAPHVIEGYEYLGSLSGNGKLVVGDPAYLGKRPKPGAAALTLSMPAREGRWYAYARPAEAPNEHRTAELVVVHQDGFATYAGDAAGNVIVTSNCAGVFDASLNKSALGARYEGTVGARGVIAHPSPGEGTYPVFVGRASDGVVTKVRVPFLGPNPPELDGTTVKPATDTVPYSPKTRFALGDRVQHTKFGAGTVVGVTKDKVEIVFEGGARTLVHGAS